VLDESREKRGLLASFVIPLFYNRRAIEVNSFTRGLAIVLVSLGLLGVSGCAEDNETEAQKLAKTAGDPGRPSEPKVKAPQSDLPPPRSSDEAQQQRGNARKNLPSDYPGNKNK
jgi:phage tail tape-measure protein